MVVNYIIKEERLTAKLLEYVSASRILRTGFSTNKVTIKR